MPSEAGEASDEEEKDLVMDISDSSSHDSSKGAKRRTRAQLRKKKVSLKYGCMMPTSLINRL